MALLRLVAGLAGLAALRIGVASARRIPPGPEQYCPVFYTEPPMNCRPLPATFLDFSEDDNHRNPPRADAYVLRDAFEALVVMQNHFFDTDYGTWPSAIDWTGAVVETVLAGMLTTLTGSLASMRMHLMDDWKAKENLISSFFAQLVGSYFGQDILSIRGEAYDDMLWVVLGWVEAIKFVQVHSDLHYPRRSADGETTTNTVSGGLQGALMSIPWHGNNWVGSFAHRARIFWTLASRGWETQLCHGGMVWNPRLNPYKNAITNELWISASISMYQHFPGDNFTAPWMASLDFPGRGFPAKDPAHLAAAVEGYKWLMDIGMMNQGGLFADGFHINRSKPGNVECDVRDEMVYTYNQGVVLTGQRGLWAVSGSASYLEEGHKLIQSAIKATGWGLSEGAPMDALEQPRPGKLPPWHGLGRGGIMEEQCDASGTCSQDGQTFKGIFFHHLTAFCAPLDPILLRPGITVDARGYHRVKTAHAGACRSYLGWVRHNALAALATRDDGGRFGMWWGAGIFGKVVVSKDEDGIDHSAENATDYRNLGTPEDETWGENYRWMPGIGRWVPPEVELQVQLPKHDGRVGGYPEHAGADSAPPRNERGGNEDPNERGRGRTVETQVGGLALLRAYWEMSQSTGAE